MNGGLQGCSLCGWNLDITFKILFDDEFVVNCVKTSVPAARALVSFLFFFFFSCGAAAQRGQ